MKKLSLIPGLFLTTVILISCSKESATLETALVPPPPPPSQWQTQQIKIASSWFYPVFSIVNERNAVFLKAHQTYETPLTYNKSTHVELGFVKLNYQGTSVARRLPVIFSCSQIIANELCEINFGVGDTGCDVTIRNADRNLPPVITTNPFPDMQIRYIVIPKTLFESLGIDWDDYAAVMQALSI